MEVDPHALIEGMVICAYAIGAKHCFIYCRGEFILARDRLEAAIREAYENNYLGDKILGTDFSCEMVLHRGAGAYICGEETALLESLEGYRGMPRPRPPFPVTEGLYACPTVVNNVQSLQAAGQVVLNGAEWYRQWGTEKSPGTLVCSVSGAVNDPRNVEVPLGTTVGERPRARGRRRRPRHSRRSRRAAGRRRCCPATASTRRWTTKAWSRRARCSARARSSRCRTTCASSERCGAARSSTRTSPAGSARRAARARTGSSTSSSGSRHGRGRPGDVDRLDKVNTGMSGFKSLCALAEFAAGPVGSSIVHFRDEYEEHIRLGGVSAHGRQEPSRGSVRAHDRHRTQTITITVDGKTDRGAARASC